MEQEAAAAIARISVFRGIDPGSIRVERLGGLTNRSYRVDCPAGAFVLRLAGIGSGAHIDRRAEAHNARLAARAGVNAEVVFFDEGDGTMLCRAVDTAVPMDAGAFRDRGAVARAATVLRRLHGCGESFAGRIDPFSVIDVYTKSIHRQDAALTDAFRRAVDGVRSARAVLVSGATALVPCHGDPVPENFLDTGTRMMLVDYEYAGDGDPMWDLAYLSAEGNFDAATDRALMESYFEGAPPLPEAARVVLFGAVVDLLSALWGAHRLASGSATGISRTYVDERLERCMARVGSTEFTNAIATLLK